MPVTIGAGPDSDFRDPIGLLGDCHRRIERFLGVLVALGSRAGGEIDAERRQSLDNALRYFEHAAPRHVADEEESLFPRLRRSNDLAAAETLRRLEQDHETIEPWHAEVNRLGRKWLANSRLDTADARRFCELTERLRAVYERHIAIEDEDLFPQARKSLNDEQLGAVADEMAARRGLAPPSKRAPGY